MKRAIVGMLLAVAVSAASGQSGRSPDTRSEAQSPGSRTAVSEIAVRRGFIEKIVKTWGPYVQAVNGEHIDLWADRLVPTFRNADTAKLSAASKAVTFEGMINALTGQKAASAKSLPGGITPKTLGSTTGDLVFTPLSSCNIVDTRNAGGPFVVGVPRHFKASGLDFVEQGGSSTNCGIPTNPAALLLGVTSVDAPSRGYFKMWPYGTPAPVSSATSYGPTQNSRNDIVLKVSQGLTKDFSMASSTTGPHALISVLGYFSAPEATKLECVTQLAGGYLNAGSSQTVYTAPCDVGYVPTSGNCAVSPGMVHRGAFPYPYFNAPAVAWGCALSNPTDTEQTYQAFTMCCRIPGR